MSNVHFASKKNWIWSSLPLLVFEKNKKTDRVLNPGPLAPKAGVVTIRPTNLVIKNTTYLVLEKAIQPFCQVNCPFVLVWQFHRIIVLLFIFIDSMSFSAPAKVQITIHNSTEIVKSHVWELLRIPRLERSLLLSFQYKPSRFDYLCCKRKLKILFRNMGC